MSEDRCLEAVSYPRVAGKVPPAAHVVKQPLSRKGQGTDQAICIAAGRGVDEAAATVRLGVTTGDQAAQDVKVSEIARSLAEPIRLSKTETHLCRNLGQRDLTDRINRFPAWEGSGSVQTDTVMAADVYDGRACPPGFGRRAGGERERAAVRPVGVRVQHPINGPSVGFVHGVHFTPPAAPRPPQPPESSGRGRRR